MSYNNVPDFSPVTEVKIVYLMEFTKKCYNNINYFRGLVRIFICINKWMFVVKS